MKCPWCFAEDATEYEPLDNKLEQFYYIVCFGCDDCGASGTMFYPKQKISAPLLDLYGA